MLFFAKSALAVTLFAGSLAFASNKTVATYEFAVYEAGAKNVTTVIKADLVGEVGTSKLQVEAKEYKGQLYGITPTLVPLRTTKKALALRPKLERSLLEKKDSLSSAAVTTEERQAVCMMMPSGEDLLNDLSVLRQSGQLELVEGPKGCWVPTAIFPAERYAQDAALGLKEQLRALALALLKK